MKIITLLENHPPDDREDLMTEHGLSFYIQSQNNVFMSDVGQTSAFADNAKVLGLDLAAVDALAISHHHYDHGGGLGCFINENDQAKIYLRESPTEDLLADDGSSMYRNIGLDKGLLAQIPERIKFISESVEILPGVHLLTEIPKVYPKPSGDERLKMRINEQVIPDRFEHELVTVLESDQGIVILTGCAHNGVLNMVVAAQRAFPNQPILAVIGGFHLARESDAVVQEIGRKLLDLEIRAVFTGHCTGERATDLLAEVLGERLHRLYTGLEIEF